MVDLWWTYGRHVAAVHQGVARQQTEAILRAPVSSSSQSTSQASELSIFGKVLLACTVCMTANTSLWHGIMRKDDTLLKVGLAPDSLFGELGTKPNGTIMFTMVLPQWFRHNGLVADECTSFASRLPVNASSAAEAACQQIVFPSNNTRQQLK